MSRMERFVYLIIVLYFTYCLAHFVRTEDAQRMEAERLERLIDLEEKVDQIYENLFYSDRSRGVISPKRHRISECPVAV